MAAFCKMASIIMVILVIIGGIILGNQFAIREQFNFGLFLATAVSGGILSLTIYVLGEIVENLEVMNHWLSTMHETMREISKKQDK